MLHDRADLPIRLANAAIVCVKYLAMSVWPANLAVYYPYDFRPSPWQTAGTALLLLAATAAAVWSLRRAVGQGDMPSQGADRQGDMPSRRAPCNHDARRVGMSNAGISCGSANLPRRTLLGRRLALVLVYAPAGDRLVQVGYQAMADRYCYIPSIGIFLAIVWLVGDLCRSRSSLIEARSASEAATPTRSVSEAATPTRSGHHVLMVGGAANRRILLAAGGSLILAALACRRSSSGRLLDQ